MDQTSYKVLVTGATGRIGRRVLEKLRVRAPGAEVYALGRQDCNLLDHNQIQATLARTQPTHLLHLAWYTEHGKFWNAPENREWVKATSQLFEAFVKNGGKRAVMAGTCAEYDWSLSGIFAESSPARPSSLYGAAKLEASLQGMDYFKAQGVSFASGRVFFPFGDGESPTRIFPSVIRALLEKRELALSSCEHVRDFLHAQEMGDAFAALLLGSTEGIVNVASGKGLSLRAMAEMIAERLGGRHLLQFGKLPLPTGEPSTLVADTTRLSREVGWQTKRTIAEGIDEMIAYWKTKNKF
jgi:nucleoside-diphosphate-sugar epimerase